MDEKINEKKSLLREAEKRNLKEHRHVRHGDGFFGRVLTKIIIILLLLILLLGGGYYGYYKITKKITPVTETNIAIVTTQLTLCQELVTAKYYYSDVVAINRKKGLSKSLSIIKYTGVIRMGIPDIINCDFEVDNDRKILRIKIPDVEILGNEIIAQEVFDENLSIFVPITTDDVFATIQESKEKTLDELINDGILNEARENAKKVIQRVMLSAGFEEVIVK